jgi:hypothetical protein
VDIGEHSASGATTTLVDANGHIIHTTSAVGMGKHGSVIAVIRENSKDPPLYDFSSANTQSPYSQQQQDQVPNLSAI